MSVAGEAAGLQSDNPFWRFSLAVYGKPGVADECLALQRALGTDVNVLLFCAWAGSARRALLSARDVAEIAEMTRPWHEAAVRPLRSVRDTVKAMPEFAHGEVKALRKEILAAELHAEQVEQALLFAGAVRPWPVDDRPRREIIRANVEAMVEQGRRGHASRGSLSIERLVAAAAEAG
jgi:uncharacterized protein (TIGR02444 family)